MILSGKVPGQEDGNVRLIVGNNAGVYTTKPKEVATILAEWVAGDPAILKAYAEAASQLAYPRAAWTIADEIHRLAQQPPVATKQAVAASWSLLFPRLRPKIAAPPKTLL